MVALTEDVLSVTQALLSVPGFAVNAAILAGGATYLAWLSWEVLLAVGGFILLGGLVYRSLIRTGFRHLKLHRSRRGAFLDGNIQRITESYQQHNVAAELRFTLAHTWGQLLLFTFVGLTLFLLPKLESADPQALTGYVLTTLYLMGPLGGVMGSLSVFSRADVAFDKIQDLGVSLQTGTREVCLPDGHPAAPGFQRLELCGVTHSYHREKEDSHFVLGPISLAFQPGELVFLAGGNGSGKSTLAKLITGLYPPESGEIRLDGTPITDRNRDDYRQHFAAVFADFHLFESLLGLEHVNLDAQARDYLGQLHLDHKVKIRNGVLSTTSLSQGQRKRLALLTAYLEDRPFYLFDEWASDQDPQFKELFYVQLLPELKARGKTVLVITHDEKYFHLADRVLKLDYGRLEPANGCDVRILDQVLRV
jgi:putative ATP-binding cassette transporter